MIKKVFPVYVSLGTNIEPRPNHLREGLRNLRAIVNIHQTSSIYETEPWGYADQSRFLNQVVECDTDFEPFGLLKLLKEIEEKMGRMGTFRFGPRIIDLDILIYGNLVISDRVLSIPHASLKERAFVLVPLVELNPDLVFPRENIRVSDYLEKLDRSSVKIWEGIHG